MIVKRRSHFSLRFVVWQRAAQPRPAPRKITFVITCRCRWSTLQIFTTFMTTQNFTAVAATAEDPSPTPHKHGYATINDHYEGFETQFSSVPRSLKELSLVTTVQRTGRWFRPRPPRKHGQRVFPSSTTHCDFRVGEFVGFVVSSACVCVLFLLWCVVCPHRFFRSVFLLNDWE